MAEVYSELRPEDIHRDFFARQESSAKAIVHEILPFLRRGKITTILDVGCGSGEILVGLHGEIREAFKESPSGLKLIGMDSAAGQIERAQSKSQELSATDLGLTFFQCDPKRSFLGQLADHDVKLGETAIICASHTIFHLPYLAELFDGLAEDPDCRPQLWLVDIFHSWDDALRYLDKNPKSDFLEPIQFRNKGGEEIVDTLFTRLAEDNFVERGLQEVSNSQRRDTAKTHQLRWTTCDLHDQFFRCGYSLRGESASLRGWGEMKTFLFSLPPHRVSVSDIFMDAGGAMPSIGRHTDRRQFEEIFTDAPRHYSPMRAITNWIHQYGAVGPAPAGDHDYIGNGVFDFILVEYAPWHDIWKNQETMFQEISLILRQGALEENSQENIHRYNRVARSFQELDLGMFLHPYLTGSEEKWGDVTSTFHLSTRSEKRPTSSAREPQRATAEPADGKSLFLSSLAWREHWLPKLRSQYETVEFEPRDIRSDANPPITTYVRSDYGQFKLEEQRRKLENAIVTRIEKYHNVVRGAPNWAKICEQDYEGTIELFHLVVREKLGLDTPNNPIRTFMISAPLRLNREVSSEPRGGIWIFAGTRTKYSCHLTDMLRNLLRECLLVGGMTVEASANKSAMDGLHHYAAQAASAAVMSRNMSHNIGSHPLAAISSGEKVLDILKAKSEIEVGAARIGNFLGYMRNRMDYIASISTDVPRWGLTADLRQIVDEFCFILVKQASSGSREHTWLIERLTELTGPELPALLFDGQSPQKTPFLLPHGVVGKQALFSIFENVLRNSDKYGDPSKKQRGQILIQYRDEIEYLTITLIDRGSPVCAEEKLVKNLKSYLEDPFYNTKSSDSHGSDDTSDVRVGEMSRKYWGLKEMKISAAYLRMRAGVEADTYSSSSEEGPPWIRPLCVDGYLGWQFALLKPKLALVDCALIRPEDDLDACKNCGIQTFNPLRLDEQLKNGVSHSFIVIHHESLKALEEHGDLPSHKLPLRRVLIGPKPNVIPPGWAFMDSLTMGNGADLEESLYRSWNRMLAATAGMTNGEAPIPVLATQDAPFQEQIEGGCIVSEEKSFSEGKLNCPTGKRLIVFERHSEQRGGVYYRNCCWQRELCSDHGQMFSAAQAYMGIKYGSTPWEQTEDARTNPAIAERLIEAGLVQILVLDDRVAKELKRSLDKRLKLAAAGVVTLPFADESNILDKEIAPARLASHLLEIRKRFLAAKPGVVIVTIHQTILDKLKDGNAKSWVRMIEKELPDLVGAPVAVVVHSGRGRPGALFEKEKLEGHRFLEFSNLQSFMLDPGYKSFLVDIFLSVRG